MQIPARGESLFIRAIKHFSIVQSKAQKPAEISKTSKDSINLSNDARDFQTTMKALANNSPDPSREDKVNSIMQKIQSGTYNISSMDIASKIMQG